MSDEEITGVRDMLKILKEQSYEDRILTASEDVVREQALKVFNQCDNRFDIFLKWLESRE